jgi:hypothetical protein
MSPCLAPLTQLANAWLAGELDDETFDWLCASSLSALGKPDATGNIKTRDDGMPDIRPINSLETLFVLTAKAAMPAVVGRASEVLTRAKQLGVAVPSAVEAIVAAHRLYLETGDEEALDEAVMMAIQSDAVNAFNTIDRAAVLEAAMKHIPELLPFLRAAYAREGRCVWGCRGAGPQPFVVILSSNGVRQGCIYGGLLFALAYLEALLRVQEDHPDVLIPSLHDDSTVLGRVDGASPAFLALQRAMADLGLSQKAPKCYAYSPQAPASVLGDALPGGCTPSDDGMVVLGVPIGSDAFVKHFVADRLSRPMLLLRLLPKLENFQIATRILIASLLPRVRFLMSNVPVGVADEPFGAWDACLRETLTALLRQAPPKHAFLPCAAGGLGAFLAKERHAECFLRGQDRALRAVALHFPALASRVRLARTETGCALGRALAAARAALPGAAALSYPAAELSSCTDAEARKLGSDLKAAVTKCLTGVALRALPALQQQLMVLSGLPGASAWMSATPRFPHLKMTDDEARTAACITLGLKQACLAGVGGGDELGRHALRKKGAGRNRTHDGIITVLAKLSRRALRTADLEVVGLYGARSEAPRQRRVGPSGRPTQPAVRQRSRGANRRMDVVETLNTGALSLLDGTIWDGAAPSWLMRADAVQFPMRALEEAERKKADKYLADKPANSTFAAFALGTQGEIGAQANAWLNQWAKDVIIAKYGDDAVPTKSDIHKVVWEALQELGVALMKAQAKQIFDHATLATRRRFTSSRERPGAAPLRGGRRLGWARGER